MKRYAFFPGCAFHASAGYEASVAAVCPKIGVELTEIPDWNCCGATVFMGMEMEKAALLAGRSFALSNSTGSREIVTGCNACYTTLKKFQKKFEKDPALLEKVNHSLKGDGLIIKTGFRVRHLLDVFVNDIPPAVWESGRKSDMMPIRAAGYYGCQLTRPDGDLGHPEQPDILETFIARLGMTQVKHSAKTLCCGASHAVPYQKESGHLIKRIMTGISSKGADLVTVICPLCQFNLDNGQKALSSGEQLPVLFFTQLAGLALGLSPSDLGIDKLLVSAKGVLRRIV